MVWFKRLRARDADLRTRSSKQLRRHQSPFRRRLCCVEPLESRNLLANDLFLTGAVGQNPRGPLDINVDHYVTPIDALIIINAIKHPEESETTRAHEHRFPDVNGDGLVSVSDLLRVVNRLNGTAKVDPWYWNSEVGMGEGPIGGGGGPGGGSGGCGAPTISGPTDVDEYEIFTVSGIAPGATSVSVTASGAVWAYVDIVGIQNPVFGWQYNEETGAYSRMLIFKDDSPPGTSSDPATVTITVAGSCGGTATCGCFSDNGVGADWN